jgi:hypothetical protein
MVMRHTAQRLFADTATFVFVELHSRKASKFRPFSQSQISNQSDSVAKELKGCVFQPLFDVKRWVASLSDLTVIARLRLLTTK